jgi:hypothetical protein
MVTFLIFHDFRPLGVCASQDPDPPPKVGWSLSQQQPHRGVIQELSAAQPGRCGGGVEAARQALPEEQKCPLLLGGRMVRASGRVAAALTQDTQ